MPIHKDLLPVLQAAGNESKFSGRVFLTPRGNTPHEDSFKKPWGEAIDSLELKPEPRIHDLRHCWKTNAMRSGIDFEMREAILGSARGIAGRCGRISDDDLVRAVNGKRFDVGQTEIWVARRKKENPEGATSGEKPDHFLINRRDADIHEQDAVQ